MKQIVGLYWFTNDLRLNDQPALAHAASNVDRLICFSHVGQSWSQAEQKMSADLGVNRRRFLYESLSNLDTQLRQLNQQLWVSEEDCLTTLAAVIDTQAVTGVFCSEHVGWYEKRVWASLAAKYPSIRFHVIATHTLFDQANLPFAVADMPAGFNGVRKKLEKSSMHPPNATVTQLPLSPATADVMSEQIKFLDLTQLESGLSESVTETLYRGGEQAGLEHLASYLHSGRASTYKKTRNAIDGWQTSCKFSPWLALGCLSVRTVVADLKAYEAEYGANDSTYWIYVELLWREYFQWYAHRHGEKIFWHGGQADKLLE